MYVLSEREKLLLEALTKWRTVKDASHYLVYEKDLPDMTEKACYAILGRIRRRYKKARNFINTILNYRRKSDTLRKVLTPKVPMKDEDEEEDWE